MRRVLMLGTVVCLVVSTVVVFVHLTQRRDSILPKVYAQEEDEGAINIGAGQVTLTQDQFRSTDGTLAAFVPTGSLNHKCLATLAESSFPVPGVTMFCAARAPSGLGQGVWIHIFFPFPPPPQFLYVVTVYQEGARSYGTPVLCNVAGC